MKLNYFYFFCIFLKENWNRKIFFKWVCNWIRTDKENTKNIVYDIINSVENESETDNTSIIDMIAKSLSKKNAVGKKTLKKVEQERILDDLFCCKENLISPFGKKIFFSLTINEIDNKFKIWEVFQI